MPSNRIFNNILVDARPDRLDLRDRAYRPPLKPIEPEYPRQDHISEFLPMYQDLVLDQGESGFCTGFGLAAVINYQYWFRDQIEPRLAAFATSQSSDISFEKLQGGSIAPRGLVSPRMLYQLAKLYDEWDGEDYSGSSCRGAMRGWHHHGVCLQEYWPDNKTGMDLDDDKWIKDSVEHPLGAYYRVETKSISDMQAAIQEVHAVYVSSKIHNGWNVDQNTRDLPEIGWTDGAPTVGGHAYAIVGYNRKGFIVQNSWGKDWACGGFALLTYQDWLTNAMDAWVAVYGAPVQLEETPIAVTGQGLHAHATFRQDKTKSSGGAPMATLWSESECYQHSIVLGNEGRPITRLIRAETGADHVKIAAEENILAWCKKKKTNRKIVLYAHGGLNDEDASMNRISILGPHFEANGMYPLFITWKSGLLETLGNVFRDAFSRESRSPGLERAEGIGDWFRDVSDRISNANDYTWEAISRRVAVKSLWAEMKENAAQAANRDGGTYLLTSHLKTLRTKYPELEIHMVGHSAGSLIFGNMFDELRRTKIKVNGLHLYAAACTMAFATRFYGKAFEEKILDRDDVHFDLLNDKNERDDQVASLYRKSLLYLVSRALEKDHKTPLLGMHVAWDQTEDIGYRPDTFPDDANHPDIKAWKKIWQRDQSGLTIESAREVVTARLADGDLSIPASHGCFDNHIGVVTKTMTRILGRKPKVAIDDLSDV